MRLLVSVGDADEASTAIEGGADIIDAKDPTRGALEPVPLDTFARIRARVGDRAPVSAAIGDAGDEATIERLAGDFAQAGAAFVKIGFAPASSVERARELLRAAVRGAGTSCGVVAVAYADDGPSLADVQWIGNAAIATGASGLLLDTRDKNGPGLTALTEPASLAAWVDSMTSRGLEVALAGRLSIDDLPTVRAVGANIAGVRGAACIGGRAGRVDGGLVRELGCVTRRMRVPAQGTNGEPHAAP